MNISLGSTTSRKTSFAPFRAPPAVAASSPGTRELLMSIAGPPRRYARGQHLFHAGDSDSELYVVESGSIKLYGITSDGSEQIFAFCLPGDFVGLDVLGAPAHGSSAGALEPTMVRALPVSGIRTMYRRVPAVQQRIHRLLAHLINELYAQMMVLSKKRGDERIAGFLMDLDARLSEPKRAAHILRLSMSRYEIGCYLGLALETVSRILSRFDDEGLTRTRARRIQLCDLNRLGALAGMTLGTPVMAMEGKFLV
ncbi:MAG: cyclic nucleotide-binding domain-containing protein [Acidiferrobacterales bacterium]